MAKTALVAGASGLVGSFCVQILEQDPDYENIIVPTRRPLGLSGKATEVNLNFDNLHEYEQQLKADDYFCCLGTTIAKAGSKANFRKVDYEYVVKFGEIAQKVAANSFSMVSAIGADANSMVFYSKTKGKAEKALQEIGLSKLLIFQPSIIDGNRNEYRRGEHLWLKFMHFLGKLAPQNYRPIHAAQIAQAMVSKTKHSKEKFEIVGNAAMLQMTPKSAIQHLLEE